MRTWHCVSRLPFGTIYFADQVFARYSCHSLPLVNSAGTSVTCDTDADFQARIAATGATSAASAAGAATTVCGPFDFMITIFSNSSCRRPPPLQAIMLVLEQPPLLQVTRTPPLPSTRLLLLRASPTMARTSEFRCNIWPQHALTRPPLDPPPVKLLRLLPRTTLSTSASHQSSL